MKSAVFNELQYPKTNAAGRSIGFLILFILLLVAGAKIASMIFGEVTPGLYSITSITGAFLAIWIVLKLEGRSFGTIGLKWEQKTARRFLKGLLTGMLIFCIMISILVIAGGLTFQKLSGNTFTGILLVLLPVFPLALMEEAAFRSYPLLKLQKAFGVWVAQLSIALAFALYHLLNGWSLQIAFMGPFIWAFVFGLSAIWSKGIAMPTGIHMGLNVMQIILAMKNQNGAIFRLEQQPGKNAATVNEWTGIAMHIAVLLIACLLTGYYIRKNKA